MMVAFIFVKITYRNGSMLPLTHRKYGIGGA